MHTPALTSTVIAVVCESYSNIIRGPLSLISPVQLKVSADIALSSFSVTVSNTTGVNISTVVH